MNQPEDILGKRGRDLAFGFGRLSRLVALGKAGVAVFAAAERWAGTSVTPLVRI